MWQGATERAASRGEVLVSPVQLSHASKRSHLSRMENRSLYLSFPHSSISGGNTPFDSEREGSIEFQSVL